MAKPIIDLCPVCGRAHVTSTEGAACTEPFDNSARDVSGAAALLMRSLCTACDGDGVVNHATEPDMLDVCGECHGHSVTYRTPTPADLLTDPRVRALVEAAGTVVQYGEIAGDVYRDDLIAALAPFEEVSRGQ